MSNTIIEMKNTLEGINSRITKAEEQISELEDRMVEITASEQNKEKSKHEKRKKEQRGGGRIPWPWSEIEQQIMIPRTRAPVRSLSLMFKCQMPISSLLAEFSTRDIGWTSYKKRRNKIFQYS